MNYKLVKSTFSDIERLIYYKINTIFEYAADLSDEEVNKINNYVKSEVPKLLKNYYNIVINDTIVGCLLLVDKDDGILLEEIYLEVEYRNKGIGTDILKKILNDNDIVYLWVYKDNIKAISLYKKLGFIVIQETKYRFYMKYNK